MRLVDSHAHLNHPDFAGDRDEVLARARAAGVEAIVVVGYDLPSSEDAVRLAAAEDGVFAAVGIHPHDARTCDEGALGRLRELLVAPGVVAAGEMGLDYYRDLSPREVQRQAFRAQLALARQTDRPVVLHNRHADGDLIGVLRTEGMPAAGGVLHCFSGDEALAREALALGLMIGVAGQVTFPSAAGLRKAIAVVPLDRLLIETDCPYLSPVPHRGRRNEPARVAEVARLIALERGLAPEAVAEATARNAQRLFGL